MVIGVAQFSADQRDLKPARYSVPNTAIPDNMQRHGSQENTEDANGLKDPKFLAGYLAGLQAANANRASSSAQASASQFATSLATPWSAFSSSGAADLAHASNSQALYRNGSVQSDGTAASPFTRPGHRLGMCVRHHYHNHVS
jgi:hypothetical protein